MRIARTLALVIVATAVTGALSGCPKHENFPQPLGLTPGPPTPENLVINDLGANPDGWEYELEWSISNPTGVKEYRIYVVIPPLPPELQGATTASPAPVIFNSKATGILLGVSAVSDDNVEGAMATQVIP